MTDRISLQEFADRIVAAEYRQPLKTLAEALAVHGWLEVDRPTCCRQPVKITNMLGATYMVECERCSRFIVDVSGPSFEGSAVRFIDSEKIDIDTDYRWIAGRQPHVEPVFIEPIARRYEARQFPTVTTPGAPPFGVFDTLTQTFVALESVETIGLAEERARAINHAYERTL